MRPACAPAGRPGELATSRPAEVVHYWSMQADEGGSANDEVDEAEWMTPEAARERLVYRHDAEVVDRFLATWV